MFAGLPSLSHDQQQKAVERIQELMSQGMSSGQAISQVAEELRATHTGERIVARFEDEDEEYPAYTAAIILISTLYSGFISVACTVQRTGA